MSTLLESTLRSLGEGTCSRVHYTRANGDDRWIVVIDNGATRKYGVGSTLTSALVRALYPGTERKV